MKSLFGAQDVLAIVQEGYEELGVYPIYAQRTTFKESRKKECKALFYIHQNVGSYHFEKISNDRKSNEAWDILDKYHDNGDKVNQVKL